MKKKNYIVMVKIDKELLAKWLACVLENGEPYDNFETIPWDELTLGSPDPASYQQAIHELADDLLSKCSTIPCVETKNRSE